MESVKVRYLVASDGGILYATVNPHEDLECLSKGRWEQGEIVVSKIGYNSSLRILDGQERLRHMEAHRIRSVHA